MGDEFGRTQTQHGRNTRPAGRNSDSANRTGRATRWLRRRWGLKTTARANNVRQRSRVRVSTVRPQRLGGAGPHAAIILNITYRSGGCRIALTQWPTALAVIMPSCHRGRMVRWSAYIRIFLSISAFCGAAADYSQDATKLKLMAASRKPLNSDWKQQRVGTSQAHSSMTSSSTHLFLHGNRRSPRCPRGENQRSMPQGSCNALLITTSACPPAKNARQRSVPLAWTLLTY